MTNSTTRQAVWSALAAAADAALDNPHFALATPNCPECGEAAAGTVEVLGARADLTLDDKGKATYTGQTYVWWEEQRTVHDSQGRIRLTCPEGHEWWSYTTEVL